MQQRFHFNLSTTGNGNKRQCIRQPCAEFPTDWILEMGVVFLNFLQPCSIQSIK